MDYSTTALTTFIVLLSSSFVEEYNAFYNAFWNVFWNDEEYED
jgi:hypothetical protein